MEETSQSLIGRAGFLQPAAAPRETAPDRTGLQRNPEASHLGQPTAIAQNSQSNSARPAGQSETLGEAQVCMVAMDWLAMRDIVRRLLGSDWPQAYDEARTLIAARMQELQTDRVLEATISVIEQMQTLGEDGSTIAAAAVDMLIERSRDHGGTHRPRAIVTKEAQDERGAKGKCGKID